ncbi:MAG: methylmalonyl Co-A mutase-associated GTPase MeaB, partial [Saprospiraceae bacterium]
MRRPLPSVEEIVTGIRSGNRVVLGQAITLVESTRPEHYALAQGVIDRLLKEAPTEPASLRIGITGAPGVGKSTLIEALGMYLLDQGRRVAVLAIDPSSAFSRGSILGDKTRMDRLSVADSAFVRPSPSGDSLGGVARKTRETVLLVEAAGYDTVLVETVGVGQSEVAVHRMTDIFLLLLLPGAGDELQGIKRGIVEMADILAVNKAEEDRLDLARQAQRHYANAVHLLPPKPNGWAPPVLLCSAQNGQGVAELWAAVTACYEQLRQHNFFQENRRQQAQYWLEEALQAGLQALFQSNEEAQ